MRRLARPTIVYSAAALTGGIALISAVEAWSWLQYPTDQPSLAALLWEVAAVLALPLLIIAGIAAISTFLRRRSAPAVSEPDRPYSKTGQTTSWERRRA